MKGHKGVGIGWLAKWYAKSTRTNLGYFKELAGKVVQNLPENGTVVEVAPGPGYLAVGIAKFGNYMVTGLDISKAMVEIAQNYAAEAGVPAAGVVEAFDVPEDPEPGLLAGRESFVAEEFLLE